MLDTLRGYVGGREYFGGWGGGGGGGVVSWEGGGGGVVDVNKGPRPGKTAQKPLKNRSNLA